jgi:hypothetical protein
MKVLTHLFVSLLIFFVVCDVNYVLVEQGKPATHYDPINHQLGRRVAHRAVMSRAIAPEKSYTSAHYDVHPSLGMVSPHHMDPQYGVHRHH